jgi:hypothetical protein
MRHRSWVTTSTMFRNTRRLLMLAAAVMVIDLGGCASSQQPRTPVEASAAVAPLHTGEVAEEPVTEADRAACQVAQKRFSDALAAAADGCSSNEECDLFETCHAVRVASTPDLWSLRDHAKEVCLRVRDRHDVIISCAARVRCVAHRCVRS